MKKLICVECPKGCVLIVDINGESVVSVSGNECPKGEKYAYHEAGNPVRVLTSTICVEGMSVRMLPIKTDRAIPKEMLMSVIQEVKKIRLMRSVAVGDIILRNVCNSGANIIATREIK